MRSPWENANGRLRRHLPSGVAAERLSASSLDALAARLNATPRRCLGYRTPAKVFNGRLGTAPAKTGPTTAVSR